MAHITETSSLSTCLYCCLEIFVAPSGHRFIVSGAMKRFILAPQYCCLKLFRTTITVQALEQLPSASSQLNKA